MCGIVGCISKEKIRKETVEVMTSALGHRGPDAHGVYMHANERIALGHTRLSIIDLSAEANQPFYSASKRFVTVFNGEIYNFQDVRKELITQHGVVFRTQSDTEVIAEAFSVWGTEMIKRLNGMFAIIIVDQVENRMFLFRDRIGKKPMFYFKSDSLFVIASEIKSLLKHPGIQNASIQRPAISNFLHLGYIPGPETIYKNIYKLPAAHVAVIDSSITLTLTSYWSAVASTGLPRLVDYNESKSQLLKLLNESVERRMISDVPLGAFLSGGIDSSLVTAIASKHSASPLKTFSIGFKDDQFDETSYARKASQHLHTDHNEFILTEKDGVDLMETYLHHFDEPFADTSAIPTMMVSKLARQEVKVALTGDGGDELFQGYGAYTWANRLESLPWKIMREPMRLAFNVSSNNRLKRIAQLLTSVKVGGIRSHIFSQEQYLFSQGEAFDNLLVNRNDAAPFRYEDSSTLPDDLSPGEKQALFDFQFYLVDDLLVKVDRASMYYALECRCPLLDFNIVEFANRLDTSFKKKGPVTKVILKDILSSHLPKELINRPKRGFSVPLSKWMKGDLKYLVDTFLDDQLIEQAGLVNVKYSKELKEQYFKGSDYLYYRLWALVVLHKWWKEHS